MINIQLQIMSLNTNQILQDLTSKPICLSRIAKAKPDNSTRIKFNIGCIPKSATNAAQAKCVISVYNASLPSDFDCGYITAPGWAYTIARVDAATNDCLATCSVLPAANITARPASNETTASKSMAVTSTAYPSFLITFAALFFVFSIMFSKRSML